MRVQIKAYSDADYANDQTTRKLTTSMITMVNNALVQWLARQQLVVAKSTCEADYIATAEATTNKIGLQNLIRETKLPIKNPPCTSSTKPP